jgi:hypothetical protein
MNGIFDEDITTKTVRLLTPYDANVYGTSITGYFNNTLVDLKRSQPPATAQSTATDQTRERYTLLGFAEPKDDYAKDLKRPDGSEFFSKLIDFGEYYEDEDTLPDRNPLFEGTHLFFDASVFWDEGVWLPIMSDNNEGKVSYDINPRILYFAGYDTQGPPAIFKYYEWEDVQIPFIAFAFQDAEDILFANQIQERKLIYGDEELDLWSVLYAKFYLQYHGQMQIDFLLYMTGREFFNFNTNKLYEIEYDGHPLSGRVLKVNDYKPCENISAQLLLLPEIVADNYCFTSDPNDDCDNLPVINMTVEDNCYTFSIGGTFDCNVTLITWEKRVNGGAWEAAGTGNTLILCDETDPFVVRATVDYDCEECPSSILTKSASPCDNTATCEVVMYINNVGQICLQWTYEAEFNSPYELEVTLDGDPFADPYLFCGAEEGTTYTFVGTFTPENGCDPIVIECVFNTDENPCNNNPVLQCVPVGNDCYEFIITGEQSSQMSYFVVTVICDGVVMTWMQGDEPICCGVFESAWAMVHYCDCPPVCTEEIVCDTTGCTSVNAGTPIMFAMCN